MSVALYATNQFWHHYQFQRLDDLVEAIGLPKEDLCTHCWDNSSYDE